MRERDVPADYPFQPRGGSAISEWLADQGFTTDQTFMFAASAITTPEQLSVDDVFLSPYADLTIERKVPRVDELFALFHCKVTVDNNLTWPHIHTRGSSARLIIARNFAVEERREAGDPYGADLIGLVQFGARSTPNVIAVESELTA